MDDPTKHPIPLDYSSTAEEQRRDKQIEDERSEALGNYNESTFGERHPFAIWGLVVFMLVESTLAWLIPRSVADPVMFAVLLAYIAWDRWRGR